MSRDTRCATLPLSETADTRRRHKTYIHTLLRVMSHDTGAYAADYEVDGLSAKLPLRQP